VLKRDEPIFFVRVDAQIQLGLNLTSGKLWEGWDCVPLEGVRGDRVEMRAGQLAACGKPFLKGGKGNTPQEAIARALKLALRQVSKSFNAARVEYLPVQKYPWFYLATVVVYPQAIQQRPSTIAFEVMRHRSPLPQATFGRTSTHGFSHGRTNRGC